MAERETLLAQTFVDVADTLVADFDVVEFLTVLSARCVDLFDLSAAALLLGNGDGVRVAASSSHEMHLLELFDDDLRTATDRWPRFAPEAIASGWASVSALPMRLRNHTIGSLNLLRAGPGELDGADVVAAQALADVATIGILQHRAAEEHRLLAEQLQYALDSRIAVEQAKGVIAQHANLDMDHAFAALRQYARSHNRRLVDVAHGVADRSIPTNVIAPARS